MSYSILNPSTFLLSSLLLMTSAVATAQVSTAEQLTDPEPVIEVTTDEPTDQRIAGRLAGIFAEIEFLNNVTVSVVDGVVTLAGKVPNEAQAESAKRLAIRLEGVVTIEDEIERTLSVEDNVRPVVNQFKKGLHDLTRALPLIAFSIVLFLIIAWFAHRLAGWTSLWRRLSPNPFLAEIVAQAVRVVGIILGLVVALNILGATALMGTILGGAGVLGIAIGFGVRDTLENYISSVMLSLRQPFRAGDRVVIDGHDGVIVRLTSRATVLMTLDGNHLRIPNSAVFKAIILNYTRNPERRFAFELGIDAEDDPVDGMQTGLDAIKELAFILKDPQPKALIVTVGDSNILLKFLAWINQSETDFDKARSLAIRSAKDALEASGFTLPEPIYRLKFDNLPIMGAQDGESRGAALKAAAQEASDRQREIADKMPMSSEEQALEVAPDTYLEEKVALERAETGDEDLLDSERPIE